MSLRRSCRLRRGFDQVGLVQFERDGQMCIRDSNTAAKIPMPPTSIAVERIRLCNSISGRRELPTSKTPSNCRFGEIGVAEFRLAEFRFGPVSGMA